MMLYSLFKTYRRPAVLACGVASVLMVGWYALASNSDAYRVETVHILPGKVSSESWDNVGAMQQQNLDTYSLYQEFRALNSATLVGEVSPVEPTAVVDSEGTDEATDDVVDQTATSDTATSSDEAASAEETSTSTNSKDDAVDATTTADGATTSAPTAATTTTTDNASDTDATSTTDDGSASEPEPVVEESTEDGGAESAQPDTDAGTSTGTSTAWQRFNDVAVAVYSRARGLFPLAQSATTTDSSTESTEADDTANAAPSSATGSDTTESDSTTPTPDTPAETGTTTQETEDTTPNVEAATTTTSTESPATTSPATEETAPTAVAGTSTTSATSTTSPTTTVTEATSSVTTTATNTDATDTSDGTVATSTDEAPTVLESERDDRDRPRAECDASTCAEYSVTLEDFGLPIFDDTTELAGGQLRLSFAAQEKAYNRIDHELRVRYSFDDGDTWTSGGTIPIVDQVSNSINGGYYLFALPDALTPEMLDQLTVSISYYGQPRRLEGMFLESAWIEVFSVTSPDDISPDDPMAMIEDTGYQEEPLSGDRLDTGEEIINFTFTDDTSDETLIIKSSAKSYAGLSEATTYFSVTNTGNRSDTFQVQTYFPNGLGAVESLHEWNQNKPLDTIVPEYRSFVYHCEAGWDSTTQPNSTNVQDLSRELFDFNRNSADVLSTVTNSTTATSATSAPPASTTPISTNTTTDQTNDATSSPALDQLPSSTTATTAAWSVPEPMQLLQAATSTASSTNVASSSRAETAGSSDSEQRNYTCRSTNVTRSCTNVTNGTDCHVPSVKVREHEVTKYRGGWERRAKANGGLGDPGFFDRAKSFLGFGPDRKEVPEKFEARTHTLDGVTIEPGETKYFKMNVSYPPRSYGEFWIETIGNREYGLLDPFWQSTWRKRLPITIDNTGNASSAEQQVFLELDSGLTGFWNNVREDGGDIRFVQESGGNVNSWYDTNWDSRQAITIQATAIDENLTDFPTYIDLATLGSDFWNNVKSDGGDIRLTESDGTTEVAYELVDIDSGNNTGELHFRATELSSTTDTTFYLYYQNGNASGYTATDTYGSEAVWSTGFHAVYHFNEDPSGTAPQVIDSTSNGHDATTGGSMTTADLVTGQIGQAYDFDASNDYVFSNTAGSAVNGTGAYSVSFWSEADDIGADIPFYIFNSDGYASGNDDRNAFRIDPSGFSSGGSNLYKIGVYTGAGSIAGETTSGRTTTNWTQLGLTWNAGAEPVTYQDGVDTGYEPGGEPGTLSGNVIADVLAIGRGNKDEWFNGRIDEFRLHSVARNAEWLSAEHSNMDSPTSFYATSSPESLTQPSFIELDHWVQHFSTTTQEADVWVQVDTLEANASSTIYLYYDNAEAESVSDAYAPFTYENPRELYYVINDTQTSPITVYSLIDDNEVSIDGGTSVILQSGEATTFSSYASTSIVSANGPITARSSDDTADNLVPISFATSTLVIPSTRDNEQFFVHAPFGTTTVDLFEGGAGTPIASQTITSGDTYQFANAVADPGIVEADEPVLSYFRTTTGGDSLAAYPHTTRPLFGIYSTNYLFSTTVAGGDVNIFCSDGTTGSQTSLARGTEYGNTVCTSGTQGTGDAVRLVPDTSPIAAIQQADSDGRESTVFLPEPEFGSRYLMPQDAQYISVACSPRFGTSTIEVQTATGVTIDSGTCNAGGDSPGALTFTPGSPYPAGSQIVATNDVPFYTYFEDSGTDDETNTWSAVQAKQFGSLTLSSSFGAEEENNDAQYTQNNFAWYENTDSATVITRYDLGEEVAAEGENITGGGAVNPGDELRLRMNLAANNGTGTIGSTAFTLQYTEVAEATQCSFVSGNAWVTVSSAGSSTAAFTGFDNASVGDGVTLSSALLSDSSVLATYEEANISATLPNQVNDGDRVEFDWAITAVAPEVNSNYCFRMVRSAGQELVTYDVFPVVETAGPPGVPTLFTPFGNEHASTTEPAFEFQANDIAGDDIDYQVQVSTDDSFGTTVLDSQSDVDLFDFENVNTPADKAPFNNNERVRFNPPSSLTNGQTYWWRVRAADPDGSNTYGSWSPAQSFTVNTSITVTEWFQTTDEQFETNSLDSARTSGSDSVELDIAGSNLIGEYGTREVASGATTTVNLNNSYTNPIVTASVRYPRSVPNGEQVSVRVFNKTGSSFEFRTFNDANTQTGSSTVDYVVMEAGDYLMDDGDDGVRVFATSTTVNPPIDTGNIPTDPGGNVISFPSSFSAPPAVLTAVSTNNDPQWIVPSVYDGSNRNNPPTASQVGVYLHDVNVNDNHGAAEDIDLIAFDVTTGTNNGVVYEATTTAVDITNTPNTKSFIASFASTPGVIAVQQTTMTGAQGGWLLIDTDTPPTATDVTLAMDEDTTADRNHAPEGASIVAFQNSSSDIIRAGTAQITSTMVDFDDVKLGNAWGEVAWNKAGDVSVRVQYETGSGFQDIPDSALPGNSSGFSSSPINIVDLDPVVYNELRLVANLSGVDPELFDWTVRWGQRVETPTLGDPFDNEKVDTATPTFDFVSSDPQGDDLEYEISISTDPLFTTSSSTFNSSTDAGFSGAGTSPFPSGDSVTYTAQTSLTDGETYWWRVRAKDPNGGDAFSPWSSPDSFTVDTSVLVSTWHQTTQAQFTEGFLDGTLASTSDSVEVPPDIGEYGTTTLTNNQWQTINTQLTYENMVVVASPEFDFNGSDNGRTVRVRNKTSNSFEIKVDDYTNAFAGVTEVDYIAIEAGDWEIDNGGGSTRLIAGVAEDVSNVKGNGSYDNSIGEIVSFTPAFPGGDPPPGALTTVSSNNDPTWVGTVIDDGADVRNEITRDQMNISLARGKDSDSHGPEDIDYLVFAESSGTNAGVLFDAFNSPTNVSHTDQAVTYNQGGFTTAPAVTVVQSNAINGVEGGFAQKDLTNPSTASTLYLSVSENGPGANNHAAETVSVLAFEDAAGTIQRDTTIGGGLTGTIKSETIDFFDGNGPRFEQFYWNDTTPGASEVTLQVEYFDGTSWSLIPGENWYDLDWNGRVPITIQASQVAADVNDFPVYVNLADLGSNFWNSVTGSGVDVRVTTADGQTEVPIDVSYIDTVADTGELHFKASALSSSTDSTFYIYYGNPTAPIYAPSDPFGAENVWTGYDARHQLGQDPTQTAPQFTDSTGNGYNATARAGMTSGDVVTGQIGQAIDLDGDDGGTFDTDFAYSGPFTASMWWNSSGDGFAISTDAGSNEKFGPWTSDSLFTRVVSSSDDTTLSSPADNSWHYVVLQRDINDKVDMYIDGVQTRMFSDVAQTGVSDWENFGGQTSQGFVGLLDELRFASGTRSVGWLDTEYNNQSAPSAFYTVGSEETASTDTLIGNDAGFTNGGPIDLSGLNVGVYDTIRLVATLSCDASSCPTLDDWSVEWGEGVQMNGTLQEVDRSTNVQSGTIRVAVNGVLQPGTGTVSNGAWSIGNVTAFSGDTVTVYVEGAADAERAATSFVYNGAGNMTGVEMYEGHLTLAGDNSEEITNSTISLFDNSIAADSDVFFDVSGVNSLSVCAVANCSDFNLFITDGISYRPSDTSSGDLTMGSFINDGTFTLDANTMRVGGSYNNRATTSLGTGEIIFTATTGSHTVSDMSGVINFPSVTFGEGSGSVTWLLQNPMDIAADWAVAYGTVDRLSAETITVGGDVVIGASGAIFGGGTTTFAGSGASTWSDQSVNGGNLGNVVVDGSSKTVSVTSDVWANDIIIGSDDTFAGGSGNTIYLGGDWVNNGTFTANTSNLEFVDDVRGRQTAGAPVTPWYNAAWGARQSITIAASQIDDDLTNFPVSVDLGDLGTQFWNNLTTGAGDVRVTTADATTEVAREVIADTATDTGELHFKAPTLSSTTDTTFYIYYSNPGASDYAASDTFGAENVWTNGYVLVAHMNDETTSTINNSAGAIDGSKTSAGSPLEVGTGQLNEAQEVSGDAVQFAGTVLTGANQYHTSLWFNANNLTGSGDTATFGYSLYGISPSGSPYQWLTAGGSGNTSELRVCAYENNASNCTATAGAGLTTGSWYHVSVNAVDAGNTTVRVNGTERLSYTNNGDGTVSDNFTIGDLRPTRNINFDGEIDEVRVANITRADAWRDAEYRNLATTTDFYAIGAAEGEVAVVTNPTSHTITSGGDTFHQLTFTDASTSAAFTEADVVVENDFSIATGTVSLPTNRLSVGGDFANTGGVFMHNNSEVRFTGSGSKTIEQQGTAFLNAFYDVVFAGSGNWSYLDTNATTTNTYAITNGSVTFPSGSLTVGDDFSVTGSGAFNANDGEVIFLVEGEPANITPRTSSFADVRIRDVGGSSWFDSDFGRRLPITIPASEVDDDVTDFPVFVDLSLLGSTFFDFVATDGADIRVTEGDGLTQVPTELVSIDTGTETGELHFRASSLSSSTDSTFYVYFDNASADAPGATTAFGRNNVWSNGYEAVYHLPTTIDSTGNGYTLTASNITNSSSALLGEAADFNGSNSVYTYGDPETVLNGFGAFTLSMWYESDAIDTDNGIFMASDINGGDDGICARYDTAGANAGGDDVFKGCLDTTSGGNQQFETSEFIQTTDYQYYVQTWQAGSAQDIYFDAVADTFTDPATSQSGTTNVPAGTMYIGAGAKDSPSGGWDGRIDEVRIASAFRSAAWVSTEYTNQSAVASFIATSTIEQSSRRIFTNPNVTATGNMVVESGLVDLPTGTYTVGGSFINDGTFNSRNGTVQLNSASGTAEVAAGVSSFGTLTFAGAAGDFLVSENATATAAINLTDANEFTLASGQTLTTLGTFSSAHSAATTTWTGSTLRLAGASDYAINGKTSGADTYGTLSLADGVNVSLWNSSAADGYVTDGSSSIYSQDHDTVDGDLYIFGDYTRATGTEHWSYATDFDGTDLSGGSERAVNVRGASSTNVLINDATLDIRGTGVASTSIDAQSGKFAITASSSTFTGEHFTVANLASEGFALRASTTIPSLADARFTVATGRTGLTLDASTIDTNPAAQYFRVDFATSSPGTANNVTLTGSPSSFAWFRDGTQNLYGEAFDADDGDPGSIRWDDSNYQINLSGTVYSDVGTTPLGASVCDGSTQNLRVVVDGGVYSDTTSCDGSGNYTFSNVTYNGDPTIVVYLDTNGGANGAVITKTPTNDITDLDLYTNRVLTRHEDVAPLTIADLTTYDEADDTDLRFTAATGTPDTLFVRADTGLAVASSTSFAPGGDITLESSGSGNAYDGTLRLLDNATFIATGTQTHRVGGSFFAGTTTTFTAASSTFEFTATTTGKAITNDSAGTLDFYDLTFTGVGGGWNLNNDISVAADMTIATGTVTGTGNITLTNGALTGEGLLSLGGGTTTILTSTTLGGSQAWTFNDLVLGSGATTSNTTRADTATTTIGGQLVIAAGHVLDPGASQWDLAGTGAVLVENGTFVPDTSTITYSGNGALVTPLTYYNLTLAGAAGTPTYTLPSLGILIENNFTVGGVVPTIADLTTNDPVVQVNGNTTITANGTVAASDTTPLTLGGSFANEGTFSGNGGDVEFVSDAAYSIAAGGSSFSNVVLSGSGLGTVTQNATTTDTFTVASTSALTVDSGRTLAVGGVARVESASTNWNGATLSLFGSNQFELNPKTISVPLDTLAVRDTAQVKTWNTVASSTNVSGSASVYSQDHASVDGDLYIFGAYESNAGADYWNYATDFDGADLSGGNGRPADVYLANGASALWTAGSLDIVGTSTASTTVQNQGSGTYSLTVDGTTATEWEHVVVRDIDSDGVTFSGTPDVTGFNTIDLLAESNGATTMTVAGSAINASPARNFSNVRFNSSGGVTGATNVTATGNTTSGWRFTAHSGNLDGEAYDVDPQGDPGYIIWDDSAAVITISGNVYEADGTTVSSVCDDTTPNIVLAIAGSVAQNASSSCSSSDGSYSISNISFNAADELTLYINGEAAQAATVSQDPVSSIGDMDLYENHLIVRHESNDPLTIADLAVWDSSDDSDIPFTAAIGSPNTLTLPSDTALLVWGNKDFTPGGDVTVSGGGAGASYDGSVTVQSGGSFNAAGTESHTIGGDFVLAAGADFIAASSSVTFTSDDTGRTITTNQAPFYDLSFTGTGSWSFSDPSATAQNDITISSGAVTLPNATTTIGGSLTTTGTLDANNGILRFTSSDTGETVSFGGADVDTVFFGGTGAWSLTDTNATTTGAFTVATGTVTLPSGMLAVGADFVVTDTLEPNGGTLRLTNNVGATLLQLSGNDLHSFTQAGAATTTMADSSVTVLGDLVLEAGGLVSATDTLAIGGSLDATGGAVVFGTSTVLFNSSDTGETVDPGANSFYSAIFASASGGWTVESATTTDDFQLTDAAAFTLTPGSTLTVGNVFRNTVGGSATDWTNTTVRLAGNTSYSINDRTDTGDQYETLVVLEGNDVRSWYSAATTTTVASKSSLYSQDHAAVDGSVYVYGDFTIGTTTEYWNYARDFDSTPLSGGTERAVTATLVDAAKTTVTGAGTLEMLGDSNGTTTVQHSGSGSYDVTVNGGTINWDTYAFRNLPFAGIVATGTPSVLSLARGDYEVNVDGGTALRVQRSAVDANPSLNIPEVGFTRVAPANAAVNVRLSATSTNAWRFANSYGNIAGEDFDVDGTSDCGSIRWDDSSCLLVEQTEYRWRNDDGGLGAPDSEWFASDFEFRQQVRVANNDGQSYSDVVVNVTVPYDSDMRSDFADLRFAASDGVTRTPHYVEKSAASTEAEIWVVVPSLGADETTSLYMYYGSTTAASVSSSTAVFNATDDFEDNNLTEYSGNTTQFETDTTLSYGGSYGVNALSPNDFTNSGIARFDQTISQGETVRSRLYIDTSDGDADEVCTLFGVQSPVTNNENYGVCVIQFGTERLVLAKDVERNDTFGDVVELSRQERAFDTSGWYEVEVDWQTGGTLDARIFDPSGNLFATTTASDTTYTSGGYGFTYWSNYGAWDGFHSRPFMTSAPTIYFGAEQQDGGATYASAQSVPTTAFTVGDTARVRVAIENTGLDITNQAFQLESAVKGAAPSCAAVAPSNFDPVPTSSACTSEALCMTSSSFVSNGDATTDLLQIARNPFVNGQFVSDTANQTSSFNLNQNRYTELEYAFEITSNATDPEYCFRVTDNGTALDAYANLPELSLSFDPVVSNAALNDGFDIDLSPGTTTPVTATASTSDLNGFADLAAATTTFYRSGVSNGANCTPDDNNCYVATTESNSCSFSGCSGSTCTLSCTADVWFHADPTDLGTFSGEEWFAFMEVSDTADNYDFATPPGVELLTLRALTVDSSINYGALEPNTNTGSFNPTTNVSNLGNDALSIEIEGEDLVDELSSSIPANQQKFATTTFDYGTCVSCSQLSSGSAVPTGVQLTKPSAPTPPVNADVYWGIEVPFGANSTPHQGVNIFYGVGI